MLRRAVSCGGVIPVAAAMAAVSSPLSPLSCCTRSVTTRGQFNPIHDFSYAVTHEEARARNESEFVTMITNPGPLRVGYSPDYLDWLYRAYKSKIKFADARTKAEKMFKGALLTADGKGGQGGGSLSSSPAAAPVGQFLRPEYSMRRAAGEARRAEAQATLDAVASQHGMLDLFERQPHFPVIHIDKATRFHVVELFKEMVLDRALDPTEIWDKALLYRAILTERKQSYPASFRYIFDSVDAAALNPSAASGATPDPLLATRCPSEDDYNYFLYLVKRYYIDNAVEGHVVLRAHREANAAELLFSNPPPKDESEVRKAIFGDATKAPTGTAAAAADDAGADKRNVPATVAQAIRIPQTYPPIEALWRCEENLPLLRVLVFGELNLVVSENPFVKFPNAHAFLTRPYSSEGQQIGSGGSGQEGGNHNSNRRGGGMNRRDHDAISLANLIAEKRGHLMAPIARNIAATLDGRAGDLRRLQQRHHREDTTGFQKLLRSPSAEENPACYSAFSDWSYFNPRAVRAEERDRLTRKGIEGLKEYDKASQSIYRLGVEEVAMNNTTRPTEMSNTVPTYVPTLPHFVSVIMKDPHVSFLLHTGGIPNEGRVELEKHVNQLARALNAMALKFHKEAVRRVNRQKVNVAAALLDSYVNAQWRAMLAASPASRAALNGKEDGIPSMARQFGSYMPFESRILDESGFPTDARVEDYNRWMAPPATATISR